MNNLERLCISQTSLIFYLSFLPWTDSPVGKQDAHNFRIKTFTDETISGIENEDNAKVDQVDESEYSAMNLTAIITLLDSLLSTYDKKRRPGEGGKRWKHQERTVLECFLLMW